MEVLCDYSTNFRTLQIGEKPLTLLNTAYRVDSFEPRIAPKDPPDRQTADRQHKKKINCVREVFNYRTHNTCKEAVRVLHDHNPSLQYKLLLLLLVVHITFSTVHFSCTGMDWTLTTHSDLTIDSRRPRMHPSTHPKTTK